MNEKRAQIFCQASRAVASATKGYDSGQPDSRSGNVPVGYWHWQRAAFGATGSCGWAPYANWALTLKGGKMSAAPRKQFFAFLCLFFEVVFKWISK